MHCIKIVVECNFATKCSLIFPLFHNISLFNKLNCLLKKSYIVEQDGVLKHQQLYLVTLLDKWLNYVSKEKIMLTIL